MVKPAVSELRTESLHQNGDVLGEHWMSIVGDSWRNARYISIHAYHMHDWNRSELANYRVSALTLWCQECLRPSPCSGLIRTVQSIQSHNREREIERCRYRSQQNCYRTNGTPLASNVKQFIRGFKEYPIGIYREPLYYAILMAQTFFNTTINKGHVVAEKNTIILIQIPAVKAVNQTWPRKINYPPSLDNVPS